MLAAFCSLWFHLQWVKLCERLRSTFIMQPVIYYLHWAVWEAKVSIRHAACDFICIGLCERLRSAFISLFLCAFFSSFFFFCSGVCERLSSAFIMQPVISFAAGCVRGWGRHSAACVASQRWWPWPWCLSSPSPGRSLLTMASLQVSSSHLLAPNTCSVHQWNKSINWSVSLTFYQTVNR